MTSTDVPGVMKVPMLDLRREYDYMKEEIDAAIGRCLEHQQWILGPEVKEFEDRTREYLGVEHCIGASSGTDALVLALRACAIKTKGQEYFDRTDLIITSPFTFTATGDAILRAGATPAFVDIDPITYNIDPVQIRSFIKSEIRSPKWRIIGILPVHLYGQSCQMDEIMAIAEEHNLFVVEDVAQAFGGEWQEAHSKKRKLGTIGSAGCFSFFPSKNLGGFGDGGMVSTNDGETADLIRMLLKHGGKDKYNVDHIGYNARLDTLQAAVLLVRLKYVDEFNNRRRRIAAFYSDGLQDVNGIVLPTQYPILNTQYSAANTNSAEEGHVFHQYTLRILNGQRDQIRQNLRQAGIDSMVYYPVPLHKMKVFEERCVLQDRLAYAERAVQEVLSLPTEPLLTDEEMNWVAAGIHRV